MFTKVGILFAFVGLLVSSVTAEEHARLVKRQSGTPTCAQPLYTGVTSESSPPGTFILNAVANSAVGSSITWSLQDTTLQKFIISPSGAVSVSGSLARSAVQRSALEFRIRATDNSNGLYCESTVRINILPNAATTAPPYQQQAYFTQNSYTFSPSYVQYGTVIGSVSAVNPSGGFLTYSLSGTNQFTIDQQTGQITATQAVSAGTYTFNVMATTALGTVSRPVTVIVATAPGGTVSFGQSSYPFSLSACGAGAQVGQVFASGSSVSYLLSGTSQFTINAQTGVITANGNVATGTYTFSVIAQSALGGQSTALVTVQANCYSTPIVTVAFGQSAYSFTQSGCGAGAQIGQVYASGSSVSYSLSGTSQFAINSQTGVITANGNLATGTYTFSVIAQSALGGQSTALVTVQANCYASSSPPTFSRTSYTVSSTACTAGTSVARVQAGGPLPVTYSLAGTSQFSIDPNSGQLSISQNIASGTYTFQVYASSSGGQTAVTVTVAVVCQVVVPSTPYYIYSGSCPANTQIGSICQGSSTSGVVDIRRG